MVLQWMVPKTRSKMIHLTSGLERFWIQTLLVCWISTRIFLNSKPRCVNVVHPQVIWITDWFYSEQLSKLDPKWSILHRDWNDFEFKICLCVGFLLVLWTCWLDHSKHVAGGGGLKEPCLGGRIAEYFRKLSHKPNFLKPACGLSPFPWFS